MVVQASTIAEEPSQEASSEELRGATAENTESRMDWSDELVESLLYLRMHKYGYAFKGSKSKAQLAAAWIHILGDFNAETHRECVVSQLKNKFQSLKTTFNNIKASEPQTGNSTENPIEYPRIWPTLIMYFGDLTGMGNRDFGQTGATASDSASEESAPAQAQAVITESAANKRKSRKRKMDLASAVAMMAESLRTRLEVDGKREETSLSTKMARLEEQIASVVANQQRTLEMMQASIDSSRQVNTAILGLLQSATATTTTPGSAAQRDGQTGNL